MRPHYAGNEADAAQGNEGKQNVLHDELADPVADGGRLPNTGEVKTDGKKDAEHRAEHPEHKTALWKHLPRWCLLIHGLTPNAGTERCGRPSAFALATDAARPHSLQ